MGDRFFPNEMPDFVEEKEEEDTLTVASEDDDSLMKLLSMPYSALSERLKRAGLDLKDTVVAETWGGQRGRDFSLHNGTLGTAYLLFKAYQLSNSKDDLNLCSDVIKSCDSVCSHSWGGTFLFGLAGVCALGAAAAKQLGDDQLLTYYLSKFNEIKMPKNIPDDLYSGRSGFLWACLFINKHVGEGTIPSNYTDAIAKDILRSGRRMGVVARCPLMFEFAGGNPGDVIYGLAGILHVLMQAQLSPDEAEEVKRTLKYIIKIHFKNENHPLPAGNNAVNYLDNLCIISAVIIITFVKAAEVFGDKEFLETAVNAAQVVWNRGLPRRIGICRGVSGNAYVFLSLYHLTGNKEFLYRAKAFACFIVDKARRLVADGEMHPGDWPFSLRDGIGGTAYLLLDMTKPTDARLPGFQF